jgi:hypothetical protein
MHILICAEPVDRSTGADSGAAKGADDRSFTGARSIGAGDQREHGAK